MAVKRDALMTSPAGREQAERTPCSTEHSSRLSSSNSVVWCSETGSIREESQGGGS